MPELPEVETVRRTLERELVGRRFDGVDVVERRLRYPVRSAVLRRCAVGRRVVRIGRRAKYLLLELDDAGHVIVHLGMSGTLRLFEADAPRAKHVHVSFRLDDARELRFRDPRRFGLVDFVPPRELERDRRLVHLGVEPLSDEFTGPGFYARSRSLKRSVKSFLMDSRHVVGIGNIYASEALFLAGVRPTRAAGRIGLARWGSIVWAVKEVLGAAIAGGGTTIADFRGGTGDAGGFQSRLEVYDRAAEPCRRCGTTIRRSVILNRSTYFCPSCQT